MLLLAIGVAAAQETASGGDAPALNSQIFRPSIDSHSFFRILDTDLPVERFSAGGLLSYTKSPLQYTTADGTTTDIVANLMQLDVMGAVRLGPVRLGLDLPIYLRNFGGTSPDATGIGDLAIDGKVRILDPEKAPVGLAGAVRVYVPVSTVPDGLGAGGAGLDLGVGLTRPIGEKLTLALDLGTTLQPAVELENTTWGSQFFFDVGAAYGIGDRAGVAAELHGAFVYQSFGDPNTSPLELILGGWYRMGKNRALMLHPGVGVGLTDAIGAPAVRVLLSAAYDPLKDQGPKDTDGDGIFDDVDACVTVPEDVDQWEDSDGCAEPTAVTVRIKDTDGFPVPEGTWTEASGATGKSGDQAKVEAGPRNFSSEGVAKPVEIPAGPPTEVEIVVPAPRGTLEVVVKDKAGKLVEGATWTATGPLNASGPGGAKVPARPGSYELVGNAPGYRPGKAIVVVVKDGTATITLELLPSKAELKQERIEIRESVYFETNQAVIKAESYPLLDEIADILQAHPELAKIRIEGHTDSRGSNSANQTLSQNRANAVRDYLVSKGVSVTRLESIGYGETKPLIKAENEAAWSKNRRVDFFVTERTDGGNTGNMQRVDVPDDKPKDK